MAPVICEQLNFSCEPLTPFQTTVAIAATTFAVITFLVLMACTLHYMKSQPETKVFFGKFKICRKLNLNLYYFAMDISLWTSLR